VEKPTLSLVIDGFLSGWGLGGLVRSREAACVVCCDTESPDVMKFLRHVIRLCFPDNIDDLFNHTHLCKYRKSKQ